mgnify:CR=1 FL=1
MKKNTNNQKQYFIMGGVRENKKDNLRMKYWKQKQKQKNEFEKKKFLTKNIRNKKKTFEFYIHRIIMRLFRLIKDLLNFFVTRLWLCLLTSSLSVKLFCFPPKFLWNSFRDWQQKIIIIIIIISSETETKLKLKQTTHETKRNDWLII